MVTQLYDRIGSTYQDYRRPDPRIAAAISKALYGASSVVNVGAGAGGRIQEYTWEGEYFCVDVACSSMIVRRYNHKPSDPYSS